MPHWNRRDLLESLLPNLREQTMAFDETIVVDNGSTDDSAAFAERSGARVLRMGRNAGFAAAVNRGVAEAKAEWIAILNNDVTLERDWLAKLIAAAEGEGAEFAAGKILRAGEGSTIDGTFDEVSRGACACRCGAGRPDGEVWNRARRIRIAPMTAAIFRRRLFEEIGGLDERFVSYMEDTDFGIRCSVLGRRGIYVPSAISRHRGSATLGAWTYDTVRSISRNQILLACKHFRGQARWPIVAGQLLWGLLALRHGRGVAFVAGKIDGWRSARGWRGTGMAADSAPPVVNDLRAILEASEKEIFELASETGFDAYWRAYFWLSRRR